MSELRLLLGGCGILRREVEYLVAKRGWPVDTLFLDSALHCDLDKLGRGVTGTLRRAASREVVVFYGACHPLMDDMLAQAGTIRTEGQNCVEMLLGHDRFTEELSRGAYFLLEEWARRWHEIVEKTFGPNLAVAREIFRTHCQYILAIRTPCSTDFTREAETAASYVGVSLRWMDVTTDHLEHVLDAAFEARRRLGTGGGGTA